MSCPQSTPVSARSIILRTATGSRRRLALLVTATGMHAAGHAGIALVGGALAVSLGWAGGPAGRLGSRLDPVFLVGIAAILSALRAVGAATAAGLFARLEGEAAIALRGAALRSLFAVHRLRHPRQADHGRSCAQPSEAEPRTLAGVDAPGDTARRVYALTSQIRDASKLVTASVAVARAMAELIGLAAVMVVVAPRLFLVAALVLGVFSALLSRARRGLRAARTRERAEGEALLEAADDAVRHAELWETFGATRKVEAHLVELGQRAARGAARAMFREVGQSGANEVLGLLAVAVALAVLTKTEALRGTPLLPFALPFFFAYRPLRDLAEARAAYARASEAAAALAVEDEAPRDVAAPFVGRTPARLEVRALVHPRCAAGPLSLVVEPQSIVALVGPTGVGKTTFLRLLLGLEVPAAGSVVYGGEPLDGVAPGPARPFAWVPQEAPLLAATLEENVALASPRAGAVDLPSLFASLGARVPAAATEKLAHGSRTLSGGERQWVALARALATEQPVLLLDEPTSGLDGDAEEAVLTALQRLRARCTVVLVTHKTRPLAVADQVYRFVEGGGLVAERGAAPSSQARPRATSAAVASS